MLMSGITGRTVYSYWLYMILIGKCKWQYTNTSIWTLILTRGKFQKGWWMGGQTSRDRQLATNRQTDKYKTDRQSYREKVEDRQIIRIFVQPGVTWTIIISMDPYVLCVYIIQAHPHPLTDHWTSDFIQLAECTSTYAAEVVWQRRWISERSRRDTGANLQLIYKQHNQYSSNILR